jgi:ribosome-associated heat shock protein Hsp15
MTSSSGGGDAGRSQSADAQRLDKWLWFARVVRSRTLAAGLVAAGKIRVNRVKAEKPSHIIKPGDVVTSAAKKDVRVLRVVAVGVRRGPASEAAALYEELTEGRTAPPGADARAGSSAESPLKPLPRQGERPRGIGRPTKRDRRQISRLLGEA